MNEHVFTDDYIACKTRNTGCDLQLRPSLCIHCGLDILRKVSMFCSPICTKSFNLRKKYKIRRKD